MRLIHILLTAILLIGAIQPATAQQLPPSSAAAGRFLLDQGDSAGLAWLARAGGHELADYGSFSLWETAPSQPGQAGLAAVDAPGLRRLNAPIQLRGLSIDTDAAQPEPALPAALRASAAPDANPRLWILQFAGPMQKSWLETLRADGLTLQACLNSYACVFWGADPAAAVAKMGGLVTWTGPFHPAYRLHPDLRPSGSLRAAAGNSGDVEVTIQLLDIPAAQGDLALLRRLATRVDGVHPVLNFIDLHALVPSALLDALANLPTVFNIEPYKTPVLNDEMQGQILAGNITSLGGNTTASGAGYLTWLKNNGFSTDPSVYPILDIVDDGVDNGTPTTPTTPTTLHPDFYAYPIEGSPFSRIAFQNSCLGDQTTNGVNGHGNLNAGIAGGYNFLSSTFTNKDAAGYAYDLGVSPFGRLTSTKIFNNGNLDYSSCGSTYSGIVQAAYDTGAKITSNSWGFKGSASAYDTTAQLYDVLTRDASPSTPDNQQMLHIFSAGNEYSSKTIASPGTAKNVLTVGATDLPRDVGTPDGCSAPQLSSSSADNIANYSSRGPTSDGRIKPDLVAPGTHIQGPASQDSAYNATSICGAAGVNKLYYPIGQTFYTWSSGTSHAAPAVAGAAQLAWVYFQSLTGNTPSPAMLKALLLNTPRYLTGTGASGNLPSPSQGWGMPDLGTAFDTTTRFLSDQAYPFSASGQTFSLSGTTVAADKPFHVTLVWTDAPGTPAAPSLINDLDLEVTIGGVKYLGNVFSGATSVAGGSPDTVNNVENIFLPPLPAGTKFTIRVVARNIAMNSIPMFGSPPNQDFAIVAYNAKYTPEPVISLVSAGWKEDPAGSNQNGTIQPGETADLTVTLQNAPTTPTAIITNSLTAALLPLTGQADLLPPASVNYPLPNGLLAVGEQTTSPSPLKIQILASASCAAILKPILRVTFTYVIVKLEGPTTSPPDSIDLPLPDLPLCVGLISRYFFPWIQR